MGIPRRQDHAAERDFEVVPGICGSGTRRKISAAQRSGSDVGADLLDGAIRACGASPEQVGRALGVSRTRVRAWCDPSSKARIAFGDVMALQGPMPTLFAEITRSMAELGSVRSYERERREIERTARRAIAELEHVVRGLEER